MSAKKHTASSLTEENAGSLNADDLPALRKKLIAAGDVERFRLLSAVFEDLARSHSLERINSDQVREDLSRQIQGSEEDRAVLRDQVAVLKADLDHKTAQLEAEQIRAHELSSVVEEQRERFKAMQADLADAKTRLTVRDRELHRMAQDNEKLTLELQRNDADSYRQQQTELFQADRRRFADQVESLQERVEQVRQEKDLELARLTGELAEVRKTSTGEAIDGAKLWDHLAQLQPAIVHEGLAPNAQSLLRIADTLVALIRFAHDFEQLVRPFLDKYTKHHQPVKVPWDVFTRTADLQLTVRDVLKPTGGKPVQFLNVRLRGLYKWTEAAMIGCDSVIESIGAELREFLLKSNGASAPRTVRDFIKNDGHELFLQHVRKLRSARLAEAFGRTT